PRRVGESVATMGLKYATVTGVARDDLPDGGAWLYAETVRQIHAQLPGCGVELLIPDFNANPDQLAEVFSSRPEVLAHNVETVPRCADRAGGLCRQRLAARRPAPQGRRPRSGPGRAGGACRALTRWAWEAASPRTRRLPAARPAGVPRTAGGGACRGPRRPAP